MTIAGSRLSLAHAARADTPGRSSDAALMAAVKAGDADAFADVYRKFAAYMYGIARQVCGCARADEAVQDVLLRLWQSPERFDPGRGTLRTFLVMQTRGRALDLVRRDRSRSAREVKVQAQAWKVDPDVEAIAVDNLHAADINRLLVALPPTEREAIGLAFFGGYTYREVAELLFLPEGTVKARIRSGLKRLHQNMGTPTRVS